MTYDELYWTYQETVVLMLKQYMYVAYDDSAKVLSFVMDYKLYESNEGLTACGPDIDKIIGVLKHHHIDYVVSEFGEITYFERFQNNNFEKYRKLGDTIPVSPTEDDGTIHVGARVEHIKFGIGVITELTEDLVTVKFVGNDKRSFGYPAAFDNNKLSLYQKRGTSEDGE